MAYFVYPDLMTYITAALPGRLTHSVSEGFARGTSERILLLKAKWVLYWVFGSLYAAPEPSQLDWSFPLACSEMPHADWLAAAGRSNATSRQTLRIRGPSTVHDGLLSFPSFWLVLGVI